MFRYFLSLAAALFLTMTVAGHDRGQERFGLTGAYDPPPPVPLLPAAPPVPAEVATLAAAEPAPVLLVSYSPEAPVPAAAPPAADGAAASAAEPAPLPVMWISASSVNLREGPSTDTSVLGKLSRDEAVTVVAEAADGWLRVRLEGDGGEGFIAARFLTDTDPAAN